MIIHVYLFSHHFGCQFHSRHLCLHSHHFHIDHSQKWCSLNDAHKIKHPERFLISPFLSSTKISNTQLLSKNKKMPDNKWSTYFRKKQFKLHIHILGIEEIIYWNLISLSSKSITQPAKIKFRHGLENYSQNLKMSSLTQSSSRHRFACQPLQVHFNRYCTDITPTTSISLWTLSPSVRLSRS